jgi:hypothetical protein
VSDHSSRQPWPASTMLGMGPAVWIPAGVIMVGLETSPCDQTQQFKSALTAVGPHHVCSYQCAMYYRRSQLT